MRAALAVAALLVGGAAMAQTHATLGLPPGASKEVDARATLGRKLFMDRRLSANGTMSCGMCHVPEQGFTVNELATAVGMEGHSLRRNAPTMLNVGLHARLFHDGRAASLEDQVWGPLLAADEMGNGTRAATVARVAAIPGYAAEFASAFPGDGLGAGTLAAALAAYERSLASGGSRFDRWRYGGDHAALDARERAGFALFMGKGRCASCHTVDGTSASFTDGLFHNTGVGARRARGLPEKLPVQLAPGIEIRFDTAALAAFGDPLPKDQGRAEVTGDARDRYRYRTPTLRNVALTAPYMHDGSLATLADVVAFYDAGGGNDPDRDPLLAPLGLSAEERSALEAFLRALTGGNVDVLVREARGAFAGTTFAPGSDRMQ